MMEKKPPTESPLRSSSSRHSFGSDSDHAASKLTSREIAMSSENGKSWTATAAVRRRSFFLIDDDRRRRESRRRFSLSTLLLRCSALLSLFFTRCGTRKREREKRRDGRRQPSYLGKRKLSQRQVPSAEGGGEKGRVLKNRERSEVERLFCFFFALHLSHFRLKPSERECFFFIRLAVLLSLSFSLIPLPSILQLTMLRAPSMRAGSAALASSSSPAAAAAAASRPPLPLRRRRSPLIVARAENATEEASPKAAAEGGVDDCADNIGDFCSLDKAVG